MLFKKSKEKSKDWRERQTEIVSLAVKGSQKAIKAVIDGLSDEYHGVRKTSAMTAGGMVSTFLDKNGNFIGQDIPPMRDIDVVLALISAINDDSHDVRCKAAEALGWIGDARAIEPLLKILDQALTAHQKDVYDMFFAEVISALGHFQDPRVVSIFIDKFIQGDAQVCQYLRGALRKLGDIAIQPMLTLLNHSNPELRAEAAHHMAAVRYTGAIPILIELLADQGKYSNISEEQEVSYHAQWALVDFGDAAVKPLIDALRSEDEQVKSLASRALEKIGGPEAEEALKSTKR